MEKLTYRDAGVDVDAGNRAVKLIKGYVKSTFQPGVLGELGGFGGFSAGYIQIPRTVLVSALTVWVQS